MDTLLLKLLVTPLLILSASLAGRRWGEAISGWFVGLPLTSGPVCFFLALDQGTGFAAAAGLGSLAGAGAEAAFGLAYVFAARRSGWPAALAAGTLAYIAAALAFAALALSLWLLAIVVCATLAAALAVMPRLSAGGIAVSSLPGWDIPARMIVATTLVLALTALAPSVGPLPSGLMATYPVFAAVLAAFAHRARGTAAAMRVLRGLLTGLFAFTGFFTVLALGLPRFGIAVAFTAATALAFAIQGGSLLLMQRRGGLARAWSS